ncbi:hypothetical protein ACUM9J_23200 [Klebsiella pneumoniae]
MKYNIPQINLSLALDYGGYQIKNGNKGSGKGYTAYQDTINVDLFGAGAKWTWDKWGIYGVYGLRDGDAAVRQLSGNPHYFWHRLYLQQTIHPVAGVLQHDRRFR